MLCCNLSCIFLMANDIEHPSMCLFAIYTSYFVDYPFIYCASVLIRLFVFLLMTGSYLYILHTCPLSGMLFAIFPFVHLFILFRVFFTEQKLLILIRPMYQSLL